jgi:hypothetical protein
MKGKPSENERKEQKAQHVMKKNPGLPLEEKKGGVACVERE